MLLLIIMAPSLQIRLHKLKILFLVSQTKHIIVGTQKNSLIWDGCGYSKEQSHWEGSIEQSNIVYNFDNAVSTVRLIGQILYVYIY